MLKRLTTSPAVCTVIHLLNISGRCITPIFHLGSLVDTEAMKECSLKLSCASPHMVQLERKHLLGVWLCMWPVSTQLGVNLSRMEDDLGCRDRKSQVSVAV